MIKQAENDKLVSFIAAHPEATAQEVAGHLGISRGAAQGRIKALVAKGQLAAEKRGRGRTYVVPDAAGKAAKGSGKETGAEKKTTTKKKRSRSRVRRD